MADKIKIIKKLLKIAVVAVAFLVFHPRGIVTEQLTITTYYPSPYGAYVTILTTDQTILARDSGNVGIGTTSPAYKLDLIGSLRSTGKRMYLEGKDTDGIFWINSGPDEGGSPLTNPEGDNVIGWNNTSGFRGRRVYIMGTTIIGSNSPSWANQDLYVSGNVGIGTTAPKYKLDVNGDLRVQGEIHYSGGIPVYLKPPGCGGGLTINSSCTTPICGTATSDGLTLQNYYYSCDGYCVSFDPVVCRTTYVGRIFR